jgi:hypothetical protein
VKDPNHDQSPEPETTCGRCGERKAADGDDWCRQCENENAAEVVAAMRDDTAGWISGTSGTDDDAEPLCPQAWVPCSENAFGMCRYCGRDLSGNPDA